MHGKSVGKRPVGTRRPSESQPTDEQLLRQEIARRAYGRYRDRGFAPGDEIEDWLAAEREVLEERAKVRADVSESPNPGGLRARRRRARLP